MKTIADLSRSHMEAKIQSALVGSSLQKVSYAITYWQLVFLGENDAQLEASEILLPEQTGPEEDSKQAVLVGSRLLALTNQARVESVALNAEGDLEIRFSGGHGIRVMGRVSQVDWAWSIEAAQFQFTCDGPFSD